jgi:uncharacterized protein (TIGR00369 family)
VADDATVPTPPAGYAPFERRGGFSVHNGPYFHRPGAAGGAEQAFYALKRHTNGLGLVHGGMLSAFMDSVLAQAVWSGARRTAVTINLSVDFLHMARAGEWIEGEARLIRATRDIAFAEGRARVGATEVVRASGVFKLMGRER